MSKKYWPIALLLTSIAIPLILWTNGVNQLTPFGSLPSTLRSIGQVSGLVGMVLFSLNFVLAARYKFIENLQNGLDKNYISHHKIGAIGFVFLLTHPLFLSLQYLPLSVRLAAQFFFPPWPSIPFRSGLFALIILTLLIILTMYIKLSYGTWKKTHQYMGIPLILAFIHVLFTQGNLSATPYLRWYLVGLLGLAVVSYLRSTLTKNFFMKKLKYTVDQITTLGKDIYEIKLLPESMKMDHQPGQFLFIQFPSSKGIVNEPHPFTISSSPKSEELSISVKSLGDFTETLKLLNKGDLALVEGPYGKFIPTQHKNKKQLWIAGGIGVTPFLSCARSLENNTDLDIAFYYTTKTSNEAVYINEFQAIENNVSSFSLNSHISNTDGFLTAHTIKETTPDILQREIFLCGPPAMMESLTTELLELGLPKTQIHSEKFNIN